MEPFEHRRVLSRTLWWVLDQTHGTQTLWQTDGTSRVLVESLVMKGFPKEPPGVKGSGGKLSHLVLSPLERVLPGTQTGVNGDQQLCISLCKVSLSM